jgi:cytochrome b561
MKKWRWDFRVWHWLHTTVILGLLGTVFLRKTFLSWRTNSELIVQKMGEFDIDVSIEEAKILAKAIRAPMWDWHIILGYALVALVIWRVVLFFTQSGKENYQNFFQKSLHKKLVIVGYIGVYGIILFMSVTGLLIHFYDILGFTREVAHDIKEVHELVFNAILIFVPLHIIGILVAENRDEGGIISEMVHGGKCKE